MLGAILKILTLSDLNWQGSQKEAAGAAAAVARDVAHTEEVARRCAAAEDRVRE
jgi:hypothetical protein